MKKIAFMFAAAALMVACGGATKTATQEQKDSIKNALYQAKVDAIAKPGEAPVAPAADAEQALKDQYTADSADYVSKVAEYDKAIAAIDSTSEDFKKELDAAIAEFEKALNAPADSAAEQK